MLEEICTAVGADVQNQWTRIHPDEEVTVEVTDQAVDYAAAPPRIVFVPGTETYLGRDHANQDGKKEPSALFTRRASVGVHVWGGDRTRTEELLHAVIRGAYTECYGSFGNDGGRWLPSSITKLGNVYLLDVFFLIPVPREVNPRRPLTDLPITTELDTVGL